MQKWEYLFVRCIGDPGSNTLYPHYINDQKVSNPKNGPTMNEYAKQMGEQGWELVTSTFNYLAFKRPKQ